MIKFKIKCKNCVKLKQKLFLKGSKCFSEKCVFERKQNNPNIKTKRYKRNKNNFTSIRLENIRKIKHIFGITEYCIKTYVWKYQDDFLFTLENKIDFFLKYINIFDSLYSVRQNIIFKRNVYLVRKNKEILCMNNSILLKPTDKIIIKNLNKTEYENIKTRQSNGIILKFSDDHTKVEINRDNNIFKSQNVEKKFQINKRLLIRYYNNI